MLSRVFFLVFFVAGTLCGLTQAAVAQEAYTRGGYGRDVQPLDRILPEIRNGRAGRFFDAEGPFPDASGGYHYRIKWLTPEGRVIWLDADARSGHVLGIARGDWREQGPPPVRGYDGPPPDPRFGGPPRGPRFDGPMMMGPERRGGWHGGGHGHRGGG